MNPYEILGVAEGATVADIDHAYEQQIRKYKSDGDGDAWVIKQIEAAYQQLKNIKVADSAEALPVTGTKSATPAPLSPKMEFAAYVLVSTVVFFGLDAALRNIFGLSTSVTVLFWLLFMTLAGVAIAAATGAIALDKQAMISNWVQSLFVAHDKGTGPKEPARDARPWRLAIQAGGMCVAIALLPLGVIRAVAMLVFVGTAFATVQFVHAAKRDPMGDKRRIWWGLAVGAGLVSLLALGLAIMGWDTRPSLHNRDLQLASAVVKGRCSDPELPDAVRGFDWTGTAFSYERQGDVLRFYTNSHVLGLDSLAEVGKAKPSRMVNLSEYKLTLVLPSGKERQVLRIGESTHNGRDVARIEISAKDLKEGIDYVNVPSFSQALSEFAVEPGDDVVAVGAPLDPTLAGSQTYGHVSAIRSLPDSADKDRWIQHDAQIAPGSSGGPLFLNRNGRLYWIGINTEGYTSGSIGIAISSEDAMRTEYRWAAADVEGAAELVSGVHGVAAAVGKSPPTIASAPSKPLPVSTPLANDWWKKTTESNESKKRRNLFSEIYDKGGIIGVVGVIMLIAFLHGIFNSSPAPKEKK